MVLSLVVLYTIIT